MKRTKTLAGTSILTVALACSAHAGDMFTLEAVAVDGMFNNRASVAVDDAGVIHVAYMTQLGTDDSSKEIMYSTNAGGSWSHTQVTNNDVREEFPCLTLDQDGNVHIAFHTGVPNTNKVRYVNNIGAPAGEFNEIIDITGGGYVIPEISVDSTGTVHFTFRTQTLGVPGEDVIYTTWSAGSGVGPLVNISNTPGSDAEASQVAVGPDDVVHLVYQNGWAFGGPLVYLNNASGSFTVQPTGVPGNVQDPMLLISDDNVVSIIYRQSNFLYAVDDGGIGRFSAPEQINTETALPAFFEGFAIDSSGHRHVAFASNSQTLRGIWYIGETEDGWGEPVHVAGENLGNAGTSIAVNSSGELALAYSLTGSADGLVFANLFMATATLDSAEPCPGDLNGNGTVDVSDLLILLSDWGSCDGCDADLNGDGSVDVSDMLILLGAWGGC